MKKLSEISSNTMITIDLEGADCLVMTKEEFLDSDYYLNRHKGELPSIPTVNIADAIYADFSFERAFENCADEMYEDWQDAIDDDIEKAGINLKEIEDKINEVFSKRPSFCQGEIVDIEN